ncbi:addiction module antidote protein, HigA family [Oleomonas cavernae]|uniref:Addiction module antidote protein, HigA family n=1 Tax=Oleomonas cavernae TaxID=2320859 RepID=A0A418WB66_9PROT|nr:HigA family addiction module antitoxin [Oleomonas cavernae]RJF87240.1 addiction module antidote protein, HigA family [Oleomonas cavernae]
MTTNLAPMHPGELLREEILPATGLSKTAVAARLHISRQSLYDILREKQPVTSNIALRLGRLFDNSPAFWLNLQANYDVAVLGQQLKDELAKIEPLRAA